MAEGDLRIIKILCARDSLPRSLVMQCLLKPPQFRPVTQTRELRLQLRGTLATSPCGRRNSIVALGVTVWARLRVRRLRGAGHELLRGDLLPGPRGRRVRLQELSECEARTPPGLQRGAARTMSLAVLQPTPDRSHSK